MVGDHYRLAGEGFCQHDGQPVPTCCVQPDGVLGRESLPMILNDGKVRHLLPRLLHGKKPVCLTKQGEVRPQDTAQESYVVNDDLIVVQYVNVIGCL